MVSFSLVCVIRTRLQQNDQMNNSPNPTYYCLYLDQKTMTPLTYLILLKEQNADAVAHVLRVLRACLLREENKTNQGIKIFQNYFLNEHIKHYIRD